MSDLAQFSLDYLPELTDYLRLQSVSAQNRGIKETVAWLSQRFEALGAKLVTTWDDVGGNPVVYAEFTGASDRTVLFYNHYDVQPEGDADDWLSPAFEPTKRDGKLFARGVCDDKGELMVRLTMIAWYNQHGGLPCNLKFMVEGEEELGSPHIEAAIAAHQQELQADVCIWEGGGRDDNDRFTITCGLKGVTTLRLATTTADLDIHSSLAVYADNAVWRLVLGLASLRDAAGQIHVAGFTDDIRELTASEHAAISQMAFDEAAVRKNYGLRGPLITDNPDEALVNAATMTVSGISGGYEGPGIKTIVPHTAFAKMDCRLVPDQEPEVIAQRIQAQLVANGFDDIEVTPLNGEPPSRTSLDNPYVQLAHQVAVAQFGEGDVRLVPNSAGTGPAAYFQRHLNQIPIILVGIHYAGSHPHAPNEHIRLADYQNGTVYLTELLQRIAK